MGRLLGINRCHVKLIDSSQVRLWIGSDLLRTRRAAEVDNLAFDNRPLWLHGKVVLHDRTYALGFGKIRVNGPPVLWFNLLPEASLTTHENYFLAYLYFDGRPHGAKLTAGHGAYFLGGVPLLVAPL